MDAESFSKLVQTIQGLGGGALLIIGMYIVWQIIARLTASKNVEAEGTVKTITSLSNSLDRLHTTQTGILEKMAERLDSLTAATAEFKENDAKELQIIQAIGADVLVLQNLVRCSQETDVKVNAALEQVAGVLAAAVAHFKVKTEETSQVQVSEETHP